MSKWKSSINNPIYAVYEIVNAGCANEKHMVVKVCKSMQTVKKYMINTGKVMGYSGWSLDAYSKEIMQYLIPGTNLREYTFRINDCKIN